MLTSFPATLVTAWLADHPRHLAMLARRCLRRYPGSGGDTEADLVQEGNVGLCRAAQQYTAAHGASFWTYGYIFAFNAMRDLLRKHAGTRRRMRIPERDASTIFTRSWHAPGALERAYEQTEWVNTAWESASLSPRQRDVLLWVYREDRPAQELATAWGLSHSRIAQLHKEALNTLRAQLHRLAGVSETRTDGEGLDDALDDRSYRS